MIGCALGVMRGRMLCYNDYPTEENKKRLLLAIAEMSTELSKPVTHITHYRVKLAAKHDIKEARILAAVKGEE